MKHTPEQFVEVEQRSEHSEQVRQDMSRILELLRRDPNPLSQKTIIARLDNTGYRRAKEALDALAKDGKIEKKKVGRKSGWVSKEEVRAEAPALAPVEADEVPVESASEMAQVDELLDSMEDEMNNSWGTLTLDEFRKKYFSGLDDIRIIAHEATEQSGKSEKEKKKEFRGFSDTQLKEIADGINDLAEQWIAQLEEEEQKHAARAAAEAASARSEAPVEVPRAEELQKTKEAFSARNDADRASEIRALDTRIQKMKRKLRKKKRGSNAYDALLQEVQERSDLLTWMREEHRRILDEAVPVTEQVQVEAEQESEPELAFEDEDTEEVTVEEEEEPELVDMDELDEIGAEIDPRRRNLFNAQVDGLMDLVESTEDADKRQKYLNAMRASLAQARKDLREHNLGRTYRSPEEIRYLIAKYETVLEGSGIKETTTADFDQWRKDLEDFFEHDMEDFAEIDNDERVKLIENYALTQKDLVAALSGFTDERTKKLTPEQMQARLDLTNEGLRRFREVLADLDVEAERSGLEGAWIADELKNIEDIYRHQLDSASKEVFPDVVKFVQRRIDDLADAQENESHGLRQNLSLEQIAYRKYQLEALLAQYAARIEDQELVEQEDALEEDDIETEEVERIPAQKEDVFEEEGIETEEVERIPVRNEEKMEESADMATWKRQQREVLDMDLERLGRVGTRAEIERGLAVALEVKEARERVLQDPEISDERRAQFEFLRSESDRRITAMKDLLEKRIGESESTEDRFMREGDQSSEVWESLAERMERKSSDEELFEEATEQAGWIEWIKSTRIWRREIEGQTLPEEVEGDTRRPGIARVVGGLGLGAISAAGSYLGVKSIPDLIRYGSQSYYSRFERTELKELAKKPDEEFRARVEASKYLTKEKRERFLSVLDKINAKYDQELAKAALSEEEREQLEKERETALGRIQQINLNMESVVNGSSEQRNREIAALIDDMIETRVKGTTVAKEVINTALMFAGAHIGRAPAYALVASVERYQRVMKERRLSAMEGKELESFTTDYVLKGLEETYENLRGRPGETKLTRMMNIAKASGNIMRAAGLVRVSMYGPEAIDWALDKLAANDASMFSNEIIADAPEIEALGEQVRMEVVEETVSAGAAIVEETPTLVTEVMPEDLGIATVKSSDGFVNVIERQLSDRAEHFGYEGDLNDDAAKALWARKSAIDLARAEGIISGAEEVRLTEAAKESLAVVVKDDGLHYVDAATGSPVTSDQLDAYTYVHSYGIQPNPVEASIPKPPRMLAEEALSSAEMANRTEVVAPGVEFATSATGLEQNYRMENASVHLTFDDDGHLLEASIDNARPPRQLTDDVLATLGGGDMPAGDREQYARQIASQIYVLDELDRAGKKDSQEYNAILENLQDLMKMKSGNTSVDLTAGVYKDYMHGVEMPERSPLEDVSEEFAEQKTRPGVQGHARKIRMSEREWRDIQEQVELVEFTDGQGTFQIRPYGAVKFDYDGEGKVVGWDRSMKFGLFARIEAAGIVSPGVGPIEQYGEINIDREVIVGRNGELRAGRIFVDAEELPLPKGQLKARKQIALEVFAIGEISEALEVAGYKASSPERRFLRQQLRDLMEQTNRDWQGRLRLTPQNPKFRKYLQSV